MPVEEINISDSIAIRLEGEDFIVTQKYKNDQEFESERLIGVYTDLEEAISIATNLV